MSPYQRYIRSPEWAAVKRRYRASRLPQGCVVCGSKPVDLHHKTYKRLGRERLTDLCPLCRPCHTAAHQYLKRDGCSSKVTLWSVARRMARFYKRHGRLPSMDSRWGVVQNHPNDPYASRGARA